MRTQIQPSASAAPHTAPDDTDTWAQIAAVSEAHQSAGERPEREPFTRFRRLRDDANTQANGAIAEDETALDHHYTYAVARHDPSGYSSAQQAIRR